MISLVTLALYILKNGEVMGICLVAYFVKRLGKKWNRKGKETSKEQRRRQPPGLGRAGLGGHSNSTERDVEAVAAWALEFDAHHIDLIIYNIYIYI